MAQKYF